MQTRKIPMRKCMGCSQMFPKKELVRVVKSRTLSEESGEEVYEISLDLIGKKAGRGAYVCKSLDCLKAARKAKRIERALDCKIPDEIYDRMEKEMLESE
ncbi:MAG: YlxR family protein [Faecalibacterium sp.]|nr:YlxR family protein [Ruminococcus sp.]MCM1391568.1 YlxR family protein [Ruminococcus sp.]MCM1485125.1 YlxR family protein [Faecalibacterium sp.]